MTSPLIFAHPLPSVFSSGFTTVLTFFYKLNFCLHFALLGDSSLSSWESMGHLGPWAVCFALKISPVEQLLRKHPLSGYFL